jgi:hypothetical protein
LVQTCMRFVKASDVGMYSDRRPARAADAVCYTEDIFRDYPPKYWDWSLFPSLPSHLY